MTLYGRGVLGVCDRYPCCVFDLSDNLRCSYVIVRSIFVDSVVVFGD